MLSVFSFFLTQEISQEKNFPKGACIARRFLPIVGKIRFENRDSSEGVCTSRDYDI